MENDWDLEMELERELSEQAEQEQPLGLDPEADDDLDRQFELELEAELDAHLAAEQDMALDRALDPDQAPTGGAAAAAAPPVPRVLPDGADLAADAEARAAAHRPRPAGCPCPRDGRAPCADVAYASAAPHCAHEGARVVRHRCGAALSPRTGRPVLCAGAAAAARIRIVVRDALVDAACRECEEVRRRSAGIRMGRGRGGGSGGGEEAAARARALEERRLAEQMQLFTESAARHGDRAVDADAAVVAVDDGDDNNNDDE